MSVNPITFVANHFMYAVGDITIFELVCPLEGTLVEIIELTGTIRCLNE